MSCIYAPAKNRKRWRWNLKANRVEWTGFDEMGINGRLTNWQGAPVESVPSYVLEHFRRQVGKGVDK